MGGVFEFFSKCSTLSSFFTNYNNWVPLIFKVSIKINFDPKLYFFKKVFGLREKRESHCISAIEIKKYFWHRF